MTKYEMRARIVTPAMIMGASIQTRHINITSTVRHCERLTVQILPRHGKHVWREEDGNDPGVPEYADELEGLA